MADEDEVHQVHNNRCSEGGYHIWERQVVDDFPDVFDEENTLDIDDVIHIYVCDKCELVRERDETDG